MAQRLDERGKGGRTWSGEGESEGPTATDSVFLFVSAFLPTLFIFAFFFSPLSPTDTSHV